ncbi:hypothetical protein [Microbacterium proteolyticum]|uniref:hypothetical protein n=1 Tax=Microbacterium proteolyticum TaxID=1572644 RepID=UPI001FAC6F74|nr:hypothetical protein [Microbacterium proteolyticum]MCI9856773.1 hypothetical protein [Microbacterium proteolyticum]
MSPDTSSELWRDTDAQVRRHAPDGTPPIVIRRAVELAYEQALDDAATALIADIARKDETND